MLAIFHQIKYIKRNLLPNVKVSSSKNEIRSSEVLILPGVGSFPNLCMNKLKKKGLDKILLNEFRKGKKILRYLRWYANNA